MPVWPSRSRWAPTNRRGPGVRFGSLLACRLLGGLRPEALLLLPELGGELRAEVLRLEDLPQFDLGPAVERRPLQPLDRFLPGGDLPDPEARNQLLALSERAVDDGPARAREPDACALGGRVQSLAGQHDAGIDELFVVLAHRSEQLLARHDARLAVLVSLHDHHESHVRILLRAARS